MASSQSNDALDKVTNAVEKHASGGTLEKGPLSQVAGSFPSETFVWLTLGSIVLSASIKLAGRSKDANFVGEWAPTFLGLGIYSKLMKIEQSLAERK